MHTFIFALPAGYEHAKKENQKEIDPMMVALCFTFVVKDDYNQSRPLCAPIVTSCIVNSKSKSISVSLYVTCAGFCLMMSYGER